MEYDFAALWPLVFLIFALAAAFGSSSILQSHDSRVLQGYRLGMLICVAAASFAASGLCSRWSGLSPLICMVILLILFQMACFCLEYVSWRHPAKPFQSFTRAFASFFAFFISWIPQIPMEQDPLEEWKQVEELEEDEQEVLRNALEFADTSIDEMMTHRSAVVSLSLRDDPKDWKETIMANRHTFYPVTNENDDDIIGVLDTRDYFRLSDFSRRNILKKTMEPAFFAAENTNAVDIVQAMKASKKYFAVVLDEYGGMSGIVTIHDILEELLGEMTETNERAESDIVRIGPDQWRIAGSSSLDEVSKAIGKTLQLDDYETFAGYIIGTIGRIPEDGSQFEVDIEDLHIVVRSVQNHRIVQTLVHRKSPAGVQK